MTRNYRRISLVVVVVVAALLVSVAMTRKQVGPWLLAHHLGPALAGVVAFVFTCLLLLVIRYALPHAVNALVRGLPKARMKVRPAMHRMGMRLLPPRWHLGSRMSRPELKARLKHYEEEILAFGRKKGKPRAAPR